MERERERERERIRKVMKGRRIQKGVYTWGKRERG